MPFSDAARFHIVNLGCKVNRVEAESIRASLLEQGALPSDEGFADLIVVNTCTVTGEADKKARKAVRHALAANPLATVVVTGCAAAIDADSFAALDPRVQVMGKQAVETASTGAFGSPPLRIGDGFRTRVGLKVQDGCDHACAYCIVHVARGRARSASAVEVASEARLYYAAGVKEVVLTGIDIGAYRDGETRLPQLVDLLLAEADAACPPSERPARVRISSIEPLSVDDELVELLARRDGRVCRHLHLPLQSGSSKVLREMARPYSAEQFATLAAKLRARVAGIALSTDVIVGFPGETEEDFLATCDFVREAGFSRLHVFPYSARKGTPAAARTDQVPPDVKRDRARRLRILGERLRSEDRSRRAGTSELALVESGTALSESYHELPAPEGARPGSLVPVVL